MAVVRKNPQPHWTQTPEGKLKLRKALRKSWRNRRRGQAEGVTTKSNIKRSKHSIEGATRGQLEPTQETALVPKKILTAKIAIGSQQRSSEVERRGLILAAQLSERIQFHAGAIGVLREELARSVIEQFLHL